LTRHFNATSGAVEFQPVIATLQMFTDQLAEREGRCAMTATILKRREPSIRRSEKHDWLIEQCAAYWLAGQVL
jgi:hypothetical protein